MTFPPTSSDVLQAYNKSWIVRRSDRLMFVPHLDLKHRLYMEKAAAPAAPPSREVISKSATLEPRSTPLPEPL